MNWFDRWKLRRKLQRRTRGREAAKKRYLSYLPKEAQQSAMFAIIDATYDLAEGRQSPSQFAAMARQIYVAEDNSTWQNATEWLSGILPDLTEIDAMLLDVSEHRDWKVRWRVACSLYSFGIREDLSDQLFAILRHDRSAKVRKYATERYEHRRGPNGTIVFKMFDAGDPLSPGFNRGAQ